MPIVLAAALATAPVLPHCSWDRPGHNPFMGDVVAAVDRYTDIPVPTRERLKARMAKRAYDDIAVIRRDSIEGRARYAPEIQAMHFGTGQVCGRVTRARWTPDMQERGLVYCEDGHCILVPTVCRNVSRVSRVAGPAPNVAAAAPGAAGGGAAAPGGAGAGGPAGGANGGAEGAGPGDPAAPLVAALESAPPGAGITAPAGPNGTVPGSFVASVGPGGPAMASDAPSVLGVPASGLASTVAAADPGVGAAGAGTNTADGGNWGAPDAPWLAAADPGLPATPIAVLPSTAAGPLAGGGVGPGLVVAPVAPVGIPAIPVVVQAVPEPGSAGLFAAGLAGLAAWWRLRHRRLLAAR